MPSFKELTAGVTGNEAYTAHVAQVRQRLEDSIPSQLRLPPALLDNLPVDVTPIAKSCGLLNARELEITELDATAVRDAIAAGKLSAVDAVTAFGKRAVIGHQLTACLTEIFLEEGIARAKELDDYYKKHGNVVGPLHGVPISVKAHMPVAGHYTDHGFLSSLILSEKDCDLIAILRKLGAVFYVKTNQPQGIMHLECHSFYARTLNPYNTRLTSGGSTGGEGALIAFKGSCLGIGSDIGGSIRSPCAHNGIYGIRPTALQLPMGGMAHYSKCWPGILPATGPMAASSRDVTLFNTLVLATKPHLVDESLCNTAWDGSGALPHGQKLRVGIMLHDDNVLPQPGTLRALKMAKEKLMRMPNVEVKEYKAYEHDLAWKLTHELYFVDGGAHFREHLTWQGEDMIPMSKHITGPPTRDHTASEILDLFLARDTYKHEYNAYWAAAGVDVVLCPPFPGAAPQHDTSTYWAYTATWNILDYPGYVFPSGLRVDPALDKKPDHFQAMSAADQHNHDLYDAEKQQNAPISLQLVARKGNDALVVGAQRVIEEALRL